MSAYRIQRKHITDVMVLQAIVDAVAPREVRALLCRRHDCVPKVAALALLRTRRRGFVGQALWGKEHSDLKPSLSGVEILKAHVDDEPLWEPWFERQFVWSPFAAKYCEFMNRLTERTIRNRTLLTLMQERGAVGR